MLPAILLLAAAAVQAQINPQPRHLDYTARLGWGNGIILFAAANAADADGNQYIAGTTQFSDLPATPGVVQPQAPSRDCVAQTASQCRDGFIAKLDPLGRLVWLTYLGSTAEDFINDIALDPDGNIYVVGGFAVLPGQTLSGFPFTSLELPPASAELLGGGFLAKLTPDATKIVYAVPLPVRPTALAVDENGAAYLTGAVDNNAIPNTQPNHPSGAGFNLWVAKVDPAATRLEYSLLLGGDGDEYAAGIAIDSTGEVYVCGNTSSEKFPVTPGVFQSEYKGGAYGIGDVFALKLNAAGTELAASTYLGGAEPDLANACALGPDGSLFVAGSARGSFPTTAGAFQPQYQGASFPEQIGGAGFVAKLDASFRSLIYSTYLTGYADDVGSIAVDGVGRAYLDGGTSAADFPLRYPAQNSIRGSGDAFITVLNAAGSAIEYSTYLGGAGGESASSIAVNANGEIFAAGYSLDDFSMSGFPLTPGAFRYDGAGYWAAKFSPGQSESPLAFIGGVVNAASFLPSTQKSGEGEIIANAISPGELITIFGQSIGPDTPQGVGLDPNGRVSTNSVGTRVLFDGIPAPLLYVSANQINAVVPWSVTGKASVQLEVEHDEQRSPAIEIPVLDGTPALFATGPQGLGQAAAINQDGTLSTQDNPAEKGSIVSLYATGLGALDAQIEDGEIIPPVSPYPQLRVPLTVWILDQGPLEAAEILYAGPAPGYVAGLMQINVRIPNKTFEEGIAVVQVNSGGYGAFARVTLAVR